MIIKKKNIIKKRKNVIVSQNYKVYTSGIELRTGFHIYSYKLKEVIRE